MSAIVRFIVHQPVHHGMIGRCNKIASEEGKIGHSYKHFNDTKSLTNELKTQEAL